MQSNRLSLQHKKQPFRGQSLLEITLLLPILLVLTITTLEIGRLFYTKIVITNAAREAAYYLSTHPSDFDHGTGTAPNTVAAAQNEASNSGVPEITVSITPINCCTIGIYSVEITVGTVVEDLMILNLMGNALSFAVTDYDEFSISSAVEMMMQ